MKLKNSLIIILFVAVPVILLLVTTQPGTSQGKLAPSRSSDAPAKKIENQVETNARLSAASEEASSPDSNPLDGSRIVQTHCAQCHLARQLEQTRKSRNEWEKTLSRMERMNVHLTETERSVLLEYLAVAD